MSIMKLNKNAAFLILFALASHSVLADEMNAGTVHFTGEIIEPSCVINGNDGKDNNVLLGTWPTSIFSNVGNESEPVPFTIELAECPLSSSGLPAVQLTFNGPTALTQTSDLLDVSKLTTTGATAATNIGVAVSPADEATRLLKMDGSTDQVFVQLPTTQSDTVMADFVARYRAFAVPVTAGAADADMTVNILYR